jgi:hypothetical protein
MQTLQELTIQKLDRIIYNMKIIIKLDKDIKKRNERLPGMVKELQDDINKVERRLKFIQDKLNMLKPYTPDQKVTREHIEYTENLARFLPMKMEQEFLLIKLDDIVTLPTRLLEHKTILFEQCAAVLGSPENVKNLLELMSARNKVREAHIKTHSEKNKFKQKIKCVKANIKFQEDKKSGSIISSRFERRLVELKSKLKDLESLQVEKIQDLKYEREELAMMYKAALGKAEMFAYLATYLPSTLKIFTFTPRKVLEL